MWRSAKLRRQLLGSSVLQRCAWHPPTATTAPQFMTAGGPRSSTTCLPHAMHPLPSFKWLSDHQLVVTRETRSMRDFPRTPQPPSASSSSSPFRLPLATLPPVQTLTLPTARHLYPPLGFRPSDVRTMASRPFSTNPGPHHRQALADQSRRAAAAQSRPMVLYLFALVVAMVGATYASVPLYRMFCAATGFGGTVQRREFGAPGGGGNRASFLNQSDGSCENQRELTIQFNADVADGMPWRFLPSQREVKVRPGQSTLAFYTAHNLSDDSITGVSTYNVSPMKVFFYIDPEFATDPKMAGVNLLTLSYTFFKVEDHEEEK